MTLREKVEKIRHLDCSKKENRRKLMNELKKSKSLSGTSQKELEDYVRKISGRRTSHSQLSYIWCHKDFWTGTINIRHQHYGDIYGQSLYEVLAKFIVIAMIEQKSRKGTEDD